MVTHHSPSNVEPGSEGGVRIESELRRLSIGGAGLFALLIGALVLVLSSLGAQLSAFEDRIVPTERAVGSLLDSMGAISARETAVLTAPDVAAVRALGDDAAAESGAQTALCTLMGTLDAPKVETLSDEFEEFRDSADDLTDAVIQSHEVDAAFGSKLREAQASVAKLLAGIGTLEGEIQLRYILLLRELDSSPSAETAGRLVHGSVRMIDERVSAARTMIEILGRRIEQVALTHNRDELNSIHSNELGQAAAAANAAIAQLRTALAAGDDDALGERAAAVNDQLALTLGLMDTADGQPGLIDLRHAYFDARATMRTAQAAGHERSLSANATLAEVGSQVRVMAAATQAKVDRVVQATRVGVTALVILGLGACVFSARRLLLALRALRQQNADLAALKDELSEANTHLEARVEERTKELALREASTRLLLDSMGDGIFEVDAEGCLIGERSKAVDDWFGDRLEGDQPRVWKVLTDDVSQEAAIQFGWDQLVDDFLPFEVAADQMPRRFERDGRLFDVEYRQGTAESSVLVVVKDWTANYAAERAEREAREFQTLVGNLLRDREGFELTRGECDALVTTLEQAAELAEAKRALHTLKGNTASFGFGAVAETCHALESQIADEEALPSADSVGHVRREWEAALDRLKGFLTSDDGQTVMIREDELDLLRRLVAEARPTEEVLGLVSSWSLTPARSYLARLERQAKRIAATLAKEVQVVLSDGGVRVSDELAPLWPAMIHLVRNSLDHGIESRAEREAAGKNPMGTMYLSVERTAEGGVAVEVADDGGGVDEALLRERLGAEAEGLSLLEVLAHEGLSSKDEVTDLSGRGVGVSAVVAAAAELGGTLTLRTTQGQGSSFRMEFADGGVSGATSETGFDTGPGVAAA